MASTRIGVITIVALALAASAAVMANAARTHRGVFAPTGPQALAAGALPLDAPLPDRVPPGVTLAIGDPMTQRVLEHTGWIKELPFKIRWAEIAGGPAVTEAFHARALDVGSAADIPPIRAVWVGMPVKMIALRFREDPANHPLFKLATAPGSNIRTLADLRGKRIAYSPGQVQGEIVLRSLEAAGLSPTDVKLIELPSTGADLYINALVGGLVDVAPIGVGPAALHYVQNYGGQGARLVAHSGVRDDLVDLYVRNETLQDAGKAAALKVYVRYWAKAANWIADHPAEWAKLYYQDNQGLSAADAKFALDAAGKPDIPAHWDQAIAQEQASIDLMAHATHNKAFEAANIFDRRFEPVIAEAAAESRGGPTAPRLASR